MSSSTKASGPSLTPPFNGLDQAVDIFTRTLEGQTGTALLDNDSEVEPLRPELVLVSRSPIKDV